MKEVSDSVGYALQKKMNLTKTIRKLPIDAVFNRAGHAYEDDHSKAAVKYDDEDMWVGMK